jgi:hypothetical protein
MLLMVSGIDAFDDLLLSLEGEVGMQLDHGATGRFGVGAVYLDLIVPLCAQPGSRERSEYDRQNESKFCKMAHRVTRLRLIFGEIHQA